MNQDKSVVNTGTAIANEITDIPIEADDMRELVILREISSVISTYNMTDLLKE